MSGTLSFGLKPKSVPVCFAESQAPAYRPVALLDRDHDQKSNQAPKRGFAPFSVPPVREDLP